MGRTRLFIARHGETEWNVAGRMQGQKDSLLTKRGQEQARILRKNLFSSPEVLEQGLCAAYSSNLGRAVETLDICLQGMKLSGHSDPTLNEISLGKWEGLRFSEVERRWPEQFYCFWHRPSRYVPVGKGETFPQLQRRMVSSISRIMKSHLGGSILVISHWIAIKTVLAWFQGLKLDDIPAMPRPGNGEYQIIEAGQQGTYRLLNPAHKVRPNVMQSRLRKGH